MVTLEGLSPFRENNNVIVGYSPFLSTFSCRWPTCGSFGFATTSIRLSALDTNKMGAEDFGELWNELLEENGEDKMVRENK